jgi:hypothetical protein
MMSPQIRVSFRPANLDRLTVGYTVNYAERYRDVGYLAIRGREQQLIDYYGKMRANEFGIKGFSGGAQWDTNPGTPLTKNAIRGVIKDNSLGEVFHDAANLALGELAPYTGNLTFLGRPNKDEIRARVCLFETHSRWWQDPECIFSWRGKGHCSKSGRYGYESEEP